jgi:hypothetical protein
MKSEQPGPLITDASLPNPRSRGAPAIAAVEEAKLNREIQALREVDRREREARPSGKEKLEWLRFVAEDSWVEAG